MTLGHVSADERTPGHDPPLVGVDDPLVTVLPLANRGPSNQSREHILTPGLLARV